LHQQQTPLSTRPDRCCDPTRVCRRQHLVDGNQQRFSHPKRTRRQHGLICIYSCYDIERIQNALVRLLAGAFDHGAQMGRSSSASPRFAGRISRNSKKVLHHPQQSKSSRLERPLHSPSDEDAHVLFRVVGIAGEDCPVFVFFVTVRTCTKSSKLAQKRLHMACEE